MKILIVDDDQMSRDSLANFLTKYLGHEVTESASGEEALEKLAESYFPMIITDVRMPGIDGIELLSKIREMAGRSSADVVIITGYAEVETAIEALRFGAYDYLLKPVNVEQLANVTDKIAEHQTLLLENREYKTSFEQKLNEKTAEMDLRLKELQKSCSEVIGVGKVGIYSEQMKQITELAEKFHKDRSIPVLIQGETGTGKEIIARMIHYDKGEITAPFISINCSAISPNLFESELFGYEGGAYTGSKQQGMPGKMELAHGGTLFLDEIGDLPPEMQPKLLRVLQEREMYRIGGIKKIKLDLRIICATNQELSKLVEQQKFRRDLYYRLNIGFISIPPLRERKEDILPLAEMFLKHYAELKKKRFRLIGESAKKALMVNEWKGNVRNLENSIERAVLLYDDIELKPEHLSEDYLCSDKVNQDSINIKLDQEQLPLNEVEKTVIKAVLNKFGGNKTKTADYLNITRTTLRNKLK
jgi:two-component system, NtrC family, response regulator AtoC